MYSNQPFILSILSCQSSRCGLSKRIVHISYCFFFNYRSWRDNGIIISILCRVELTSFSHPQFNTVSTVSWFLFSFLSSNSETILTHLQWLSFLIAASNKSIFPMWRNSLRNIIEYFPFPSVAKEFLHCNWLYFVVF